MLVGVVSRSVLSSLFCAACSEQVGADAACPPTVQGTLDIELSSAPSLSGLHDLVARFSVLSLAEPKFVA